jgi:NADH dehydrogenase
LPCDKLRKAGVDVRLKTGAQEITAAGVRLESGELIEAATVVSTVGTLPNPLIQELGLPLEHGRLVTDPYMRVRGATNVWAVGDCAIIPNAFDKRPSPATAQFAMRQAKQLAANLARTFKGQPTRPFSFRALGMLVSLGNRTAVAEILGIHISGFVAWALWRGVYLLKLPSLARKLEVVGFRESPRANDKGLLKLATTILTPWSVRLTGSIEIQRVTGAALWHLCCATRSRNDSVLFPLDG